MSKLNPEHVTEIVKAVLAATKRSGRLPTRLDEEDYEDLLSEGVLAALLVADKYDPDRGTLRTYLDKPVSRAIIKAAWRIANVGITGDHGALQVWSMDDAGAHIDDGVPEELDLPQVPDVAEEIEAFDHVWHTRYTRDST